MKFFAIFAALIAVACGQQTWTLNQLSAAINDPYLDPAIKPVLTSALNSWMVELFNGNQVESININIPAVDLSGWTLNELSEALQNPETDPALVPHLTQLLNQMMDAIVSGQVVPAAASIVMPAMDVTPWNLNELSLAIQDPATNPELLPYLESALNTLMEALFDGHVMEVIAVVTPAGLIDVPAVIAPSPVVVAPSPVEVEPVVVAPSPVEVNPVVVAPSPVESPAPVESVQTPVAAASSPLVQIILNINQE